MSAGKRAPQVVVSPQLDTGRQQPWPGARPHSPSGGGRLSTPERVEAWSPSAGSSLARRRRKQGLVWGAQFFVLDSPGKQISPTGGRGWRQTPAEEIMEEMGSEGHAQDPDCVSVWR